MLTAAPAAAAAIAAAIAVEYPLHVFTNPYIIALTLGFVLTVIVVLRSKRPPR